VLQGEAVQASIDARYYFGEPVTARSAYAVYRDRYWFRLYDPDDATSEDIAARQRRHGDQVAEGRRAGCGWQAHRQRDTTVSEHKADYLYRVDARVTDLGKRGSPARLVVATYAASCSTPRPTVTSMRRVGPAVTVEARDYDNKPSPPPSTSR